MALPPSAYQQWKASAPEVAVIEIVAASRETTIDEMPTLRRPHIHVEAEAKVASVSKSESGITAGATIHLRYQQVPLYAERLENGQWVKVSMVGATPVPILEKGDKVTAWLKPIGDGAYEPAAGGESFLPFVVPPEPTAKTD